MTNLIKTGRCIYGIGIIAYGLQQIIVRDFRPQIVPVFPAWAHQYAILPIITGIALVIIGIVITGVYPIKGIHTRKLCLYLGFFFLALIILCHLPYTLYFSPNKAIHLGVWVDMLKELAFAGGAFVMAGSFNNSNDVNKNSFTALLEKLIPFGRIFFSITIILFGYAHFVYIDFVATMVPAWFGIATFWTYFAGAALMASGIAIILKLWLRQVALLLAIMLFLWVFMVHLPRATADPYAGNGNEIISTFDAFLFCGIALVIAGRKKVRGLN